MTEERDVYTVAPPGGGGDKLAAALSKAQAKMTNPPKTKNGQFRGGRYKYADLADVLDHVRVPLTENGLCLVQMVMPGVLVTRLMHASGQYIESQYPLPTERMTPQDMGSYITYARRYAVCPILGIAGETDDDGAGAASGEAATEEAVDGEKKRLALVRLEEAKAKGRVRSAHDGRVLKPGEEPLPAAGNELGMRGQESGVGSQGSGDRSQTETRKPASPAAGGATVPPGAAPAAAPPGGPPAAGAAGIDPRLAKVMARDGVSREALKAFAVRGKFILPEMELSQVRADFVTACLNPANWSKVVAFAKGGK